MSGPAGRRSLRPNLSQHTLIVIGVVITATLGAAVIARASQLSSDGSVLDEQSLQATVQYQERLTQEQMNVADDLRLLGSYAEALSSKRVLLRQAGRPTNQGPIARQLAGAAKTQAALAQSIYAQFNIRPTKPDEYTGTLFYPTIESRSTQDCSRTPIDQQCAVDELIESDHLHGVDADPLAYHPEDVFLAEEAERLHSRAVRLVGIAALLVAALVLFTAAQIPRGWARTILAGAAAAVVVVAMLLFVLVNWVVM